jgi:phage terminase large subunit
LWIEEAYEIMSESDFDTIDESIRGEVPDPLFKQVTMTFNPWNEHHWIMARFFDAEPDPDILAITTNYLCNEWLDEADKKVFERMKKQNPRRYRVAGLGDWGIVDGLVYENWKEQPFSLAEIQKQYPGLKSGFGLDYGYTNDPSAAFIGFIDLESKTIFVWDEMYEKGLSNRKIYNNLVSMGYGKDRFTGDSAEPKSNAELQDYGLRIKGAEKGKDSVNNGIQWIQDCTIIIHPRCVNFLTEISNYTWSKDRFGKILNTPIDDFNHLMDAMRYGFEQFIKNNQWLY